MTMVALVIGAVVGCGHDTVAPHPRSGEMPMSLNTVTAQQVMTAITKAGLPALNPHDVTAQQCPKLGCTQAISADTVSVFKFPATGMAQKYAGSISSDYQLEDLVLVFAPSVTPDLKREYEKVVERTAA
jgi:hypothetical protein